MTLCGTSLASIKGCENGLLTFHRNLKQDVSLLCSELALFRLLGNQHFEGLWALKDWSSAVLLIIL